MSTTPRRRPAALLAAAGATALAVTACGGGSSGPVASSSPLPTSSSTVTSPAPSSVPSPTLTPAPSTAAEPTSAFTGGTFGPVVRAGMPTPASLLTGLRVAHHQGYDRVVFELSGAVPGYRVAYVREVLEDPSGQRVGLQGDARLLVTLRGATTDTSFQTTEGATPSSYTGPRRLLPDLPSVMEVRLVGDFEAVLSAGIGVDHKVPFRVFTLNNPTRVVVDVQAEPHE
ncbi:MAG TPA: hypothetical protein VFS29_02040 [Motilibacteraceae bacterium]|nr:hypothetical protein [Motilibacteraceae bacterium]